MHRAKRALIIATSGTCAALLSGVAAARNGSDGSTLSGSPAGTFTVTMQVTIAANYRTCPPGTPADATGCFSRKGAADVRRLGRVEESWDPVVDETPASCGPASLRFLPSTARLTVSGKGAINVQVNGSGCLRFNPPSPVVGAETFTVTGGSGRFAGASGAGTIDHFSNGRASPGTTRGVAPSSCRGSSST